MRNQINLQDVYDVYATLENNYEAKTMLLSSIKKIGLEEEFADFLKGNPVPSKSALNKNWYRVIATYSDGLTATSYNEAENASVAILLGFYWAFDDVKAVKAEFFA